MATREITETLCFPVLEEFYRPSPNKAYGRMMTMPPVNIRETKESYVLSLAVPGIKREELKLILDGSILCISSQKEEIKERYTWKEFNLYSFSRSFTLPDDVKPGAIEARYEDGILLVVLLRKERVKQTTANTQVAVH